mmetsp:Transcript_17927/g.27726  ORF Transcript_17927/g.27726 Transcript_17927/m.27726 type:complete len:122 (+) Transcript_17927:622-987(+)
MPWALEIQVSGSSLGNGGQQREMPRYQPVSERTLQPEGISKTLLFVLADSIRGCNGSFRTRQPAHVSCLHGFRSLLMFFQCGPIRSSCSVSLLMVFSKTVSHMCSTHSCPILQVCAEFDLM